MHPSPLAGEDAEGGAVRQRRATLMQGWRLIALSRGEACASPTPLCPLRGISPIRGERGARPGEVC